MKKALTVFTVVLLSAAFLFAGGKAESDNEQVSGSRVFSFSSLISVFSLYMI